ncbi:MAG TPA: DUF2844 domain-containing protein [Geobacteraceae bacterium]
MKRYLRVSARVARLAIVSLLVSSHALATLGEPVGSVAQDGKTLSAARRTTTVHTGYTVEQVVADAYTVREYVSPAGVVFAIAWNGLAHPDLSPLLGSYAGEYKQAMRQTPRVQGRRHSSVKTNRVIVEKWGHMRNLQGRAYVPALIPPGVGIDEIK